MGISGINGFLDMLIASFQLFTYTFSPVTLRIPFILPKITCYTQKA
jgi:hypothetical protein